MLNSASICVRMSSFAIKCLVVCCLLPGFSIYSWCIGYFQKLPMQDELQPFKKDGIKCNISQDCVTDAKAARAWAQTLIAGMDKPDAEAMQAIRGNVILKGVGDLQTKLVDEVVVHLQMNALLICPWLLRHILSRHKFA
jgi:hypothetical protein